MIPVLVIKVHVPGGGRGHGGRGDRRHDDRSRKRFGDRRRKRHGARGSNHAVAGHGGDVGRGNRVCANVTCPTGRKALLGRAHCGAGCQAAEIVMRGKCPCQRHKGIKHKRGKVCKGKDCDCKAVWAETGGDCWKCKSGKEKYPELKL